jgi:hypothetical protein
VRHEGRESLSKAGIGELANRVDVAMDKALEVGTKALGIYAARKPAIIQATQEACQCAVERWMFRGRTHVLNLLYPRAKFVNQ